MPSWWRCPSQPPPPPGAFCSVRPHPTPPCKPAVAGPSPACLPFLTGRRRRRRRRRKRRLWAEAEGTRGTAGLRFSGTGRDGRAQLPTSRYHLGWAAASAQQFCSLPFDPPPVSTMGATEGRGIHHPLPMSGCWGCHGHPGDTAVIPNGSPGLWLMCGESPGCGPSWSGATVAAVQGVPCGAPGTSGRGDGQHPEML